VRESLTLSARSSKLLLNLESIKSAICSAPELEEISRSPRRDTLRAWGAYVLRIVTFSREVVGPCCSRFEVSWLSRATDLSLDAAGPQRAATSASSSRPDILRPQDVQGHIAQFNPAQRRRSAGISRKLQEDHIPETRVYGIQTLHNNRWWDGGWPASVAGHPRPARSGDGRPGGGRPAIMGGCTHRRQAWYHLVHRPRHGARCSMYHRAPLPLRTQPWGHAVLALCRSTGGTVRTGRSWGPEGRGYEDGSIKRGDPELSRAPRSPNRLDLVRPLMGLDLLVIK